MATGTQIRIGRVLAGWDAKTLAELTGLSKESILNIERGTFRARPATMEKILRVFDDAEIEFTENEGVRRRPEGVEIFVGHERFHEFTEFVYQHLVQYGGEVCISASDERLFLKYRKEPEVYRQRMKALVDTGRVKVRILAEESNFNSIFAEMRKSAQKGTAPTSFYAFGKCLALISFAHTPSPYVVLLKSGPFAEAYRQAFNESWGLAEIPAEKQ
jgi:transcriptional regulator with XRE-family HTH domain